MALIVIPGQAEAKTMMVGESAVMQKLRADVARVGATNFTVLIEGESGVGKELVARSLHHFSSRKRGPFVAVNCAALVESLLEAELFGIEERTATGVRGRRGKFELAEGGTLFLDEVADLSVAAQAKLLRVLQDLSVERVGGHGPREVDTRVIAATNRRLFDMMLAKRFREDLFYRLSGVELQVPPLRARREDIPALARHLLERHRPGRPLRLTEAALDALIAFDWPGNVRQLERMLERAIALAPGAVVDLNDLPDTVVHGYRELLDELPQTNETLRTWTSRYVRVVLDRCQGNKRRACDLLDISYHTLRSHLASAQGASRGDARTP
jgi:transcriptional regulator with PAS, ATPase and Fis domain